MVAKMRRSLFFNDNSIVSFVFCHGKQQDRNKRMFVKKKKIKKKRLRYFYMITHKSSWSSKSFSFFFPIPLKLKLRIEDQGRAMARLPFARYRKKIVFIKSVSLLCNIES